MGSEHHLHILLRNLIDNAVRYTPSGGQVDVTIRASQDDILLEIEDSGPGIPADERERVFDRFYRCLVPQATGSGLGLAIVKQVAELHQAEVKLGQAPRLAGLKASIIFKRAA
jgi:two-component system OmpR family sensor kinase